MIVFDRNQLVRFMRCYLRYCVDRQFIVEVKTRLSQATLGMAVHQLQRFPQKGLMVTDYVNPKMCADLLATGDARNLETARIIYEQELAGPIREN
jgi:hypothetical protein